MKFKKILSIGIAENQLDSEYWNRINSLTEQRVALLEDDPLVDKHLADADCLLVYFNKVDQTLINKAPHLKYIGALATGVGKIDKEYAKTKGITVTNIPGYSTEAVAELVFGVLLENLRDLSRAKVESKQQRTSESGFSGREIRGGNFGVIGLGSIGSRVAELAKSFGANVSYWSKTRKPQAESNGINYYELEELLKTSDIISVNLALNKETENILDQDKIALIKNGAIVINTAPLELFDLNALEDKLKKGEITYIFDHTDPGDISDEDLIKLKQYVNCITYPVLGYITKEARIAKQEIFVANMEKFLEGTSQNEVS